MITPDPIPLTSRQLQALERARVLLLQAGVPPSLLSAYDEVCDYPNDLGLTYSDFCQDRLTQGMDGELLIQNAQYFPQLFAATRDQAGPILPGHPSAGPGMPHQHWSEPTPTANGPGPWQGE